jgi:hypothetical protein
MKEEYRFTQRMDGPATECGDVLFNGHNDEALQAKGEK